MQVMNQFDFLTIKRLSRNYSCHIGRAIDYQLLNPQNYISNKHRSQSNQSSVLHCLQVYCLWSQKLYKFASEGKGKF